MPAQRIYNGPYRVVGVFPEGWEIKQWEVTYGYEDEQGRWCYSSLIPQRIFDQRQGAYRCAANLNKQWMLLHPNATAENITGSLSS